MKKWVVSYIITLAIPTTLCPRDEAIHGFRAIDPILLEKKVPTGYRKVFVEAGRQNNIDPVVLAAISAYDSYLKRQFITEDFLRSARCSL